LWVWRLVLNEESRSPRILHMARRLSLEFLPIRNLFLISSFSISSRVADMRGSGRWRAPFSFALFPFSLLFRGAQDPAPSYQITVSLSAPKSVIRRKISHSDWKEFSLSQLAFSLAFLNLVRFLPTALQISPCPLRKVSI
jgi:hypothetical protein